MEPAWEVIVTKGDCEPWWFFESWEKDISSIYSFDNKEDAINKYREIFHHFKKSFANSAVKRTSLAAFWNKGEIVYCEHCEDDLQLYNGLLIMHGRVPYTFTEEELSMLD